MNTATDTGRPRRRRRLVAAMSAPLMVLGPVCLPQAHADNSRLNASVVSNVYTIHRHAGCTDDLRVSPSLRLAAQWHTDDLLANYSLDGDPGSDGSSVADRAATAGYRGAVAETVAVNPALAISGIELINQWYYNPAYLAIMQNCSYTQIGVWSGSRPDRTVVVAVYGRPT